MPTTTPIRGRLDVAMVGDMCVDLLLSGDVRPRFGQVEQLVDGCELDVGGSANIFACQLARLGLTTGVIGKVGNDALGDIVRRRMEECGVDVSAIQSDPSLRTGIGVHLCEQDDRAILTFAGAIADAGPSDLPDNPYAYCRHWHIASYYLLRLLQPHWPVFLDGARKQGVTVSLDPNWDPDEEWGGVLPLLPLLNILFVNEAEVCLIAAREDPETAARKLALQCPLVVVKQGKNGAFAVRGSEVIRLDMANFPAVANIIDSVGAGDTFDAGFLSAWLSGQSIPDSLRRGHICAAASLAAAGGVAGQLSAYDLHEMKGNTYE